MTLDQKEAKEFSGLLYRQIVDFVADAIVVADRQGHIVIFNDAAEKMFGWSKDQILGCRLEQLLPHRYRPGHAVEVQAFTSERAPARFMGHRRSDIFGLRKDGVEIPLAASIAVIADDDGPMAVAVLRDISQQLKLTGKLKHLANVDSLTGSMNRRAFLSVAKREWGRAVRSDTEIGVLFFDLDLFKRVNDTYGHSVGDEVLCYFADLAQSMLREYDIFTRWGGEEFIAVLPGADGPVLQGVADRIREQFWRHRFLSDGRVEFRVSVSVGIADNSNRETDLSQAIKLADAALYRAKAETACKRKLSANPW